MPLFSPIVASGQNIGWSDVPLVRGAANTLSLENSTNAMALWVHGTTDSTRSNYRRIRASMTTGGAATIAAEGLGTGVSGNQLIFSQNGTTVLSFNSGSAIATFGASLLVPTSSGIGWTASSYFAAPSDGIIRLTQNSGSGFNRLNFGGDTSSFPSLKRSTTILQGRLADDSDFCTIQGKLRTDNAYAAGAPGAATGTVTITDSTGTAYRIPVLV